MSTPADSDLTQLNYDALISKRRGVRERLECLPPHAKQRAALVELYDRLTEEFDRRAREAWAKATHVTSEGPQ